MATIGMSMPILFKLKILACVTSIILSRNFSLDKKPLNGGIPAILNDVINVIVKEIGMIVTKPPNLLTSRVPVL